jgi:hypothetical protein
MIRRATWFLCLTSCLSFFVGTTACSGKKAPTGPPTCTKTSDCPTGEVCHANLCVSLPCGGRCSSDQVCLNNACHSATGLDCSTDPNRCPANTYACTNGKCRRSCTTDSDCPQPLLCNVDLFLCAECNSDRECMMRTGGDPTKVVCDTSIGACVGCLTNSTCYSGGRPDDMYCDTTTQTCQSGCQTIADCPTGTKSCQGASNGVAGQCIECSADTDCVNGAVPHCDVPTNLCVQCLRNDQCASNQCDTKGHRCVDCVQDLACGRGQVCDQSTFKCTPGCSGGSGDSQCPPDDAVCDASKGTFGQCVICLTDGDCGRDQLCDTGGSQPACIPGCRDDAKCASTDPTVTATICDKAKGAHGTCVQCRVASDCQNGEVCDPTTEACRCKAEGEACTTTSDCGYIPGSTSTTMGCSDAERTAHHAFCIKTVECAKTGESNKPVSASVCVMLGMNQGFADRTPPDTQGCPNGYAVERASDGVLPYWSVCVPNQTPYTCP